MERIYITLRIYGTCLYYLAMRSHLPEQVENHDNYGNNRRNGIVGLINSATHSIIGMYIGLVLGVWFIIALPGSYLCLWLARKGHTKAADLLQLGVFGFWMFCIACTFEAYIKELSGADKVWIRTVRDG